MKKITATLVMGLLLAFGVIGVSAQDEMKQDTMSHNTMKHKRHHKMMKKHNRHHKMMKKHHTHHKMMKKSM
jgi:CHASE3 domain sensor protein